MPDFLKCYSFHRVLTGQNLKITVIGYSYAFGILCSTICDSKRWKRYNILPYDGQKIAKSASKVPFWHGDAASAVRYHDVSSRCTKNWIMAPLWILFSHYMITCKAFWRVIDTLSHIMWLLSQKSKCYNAWFSKIDSFYRVLTGQNLKITVIGTSNAFGILCSTILDP